MDAALAGEARYDKYLEQMRYHDEQDVFAQTRRAQEAFQRLCEHNKRRQQERCVQNKVGGGLLQLELKDIEVVQQLQREVDAEITRQYVGEPRAQTYQLRPVVPAFFTGLDTDYNAPAETVFDEEAGGYSCPVHQPNRSDFTPQPESLLEYRADNRAFFRDVINRVILRNRAERQLGLIREKILKRGEKGRPGPASGILDKVSARKATPEDVSTFAGEIRPGRVRPLAHTDAPDRTVFLRADEEGATAVRHRVANAFYEQAEARAYEPREWAAE